MTHPNETAMTLLVMSEDGVKERVAIAGFIIV